MKCEVLMLLVLLQVDASYQQNILPEHKRRHCKALQEMDIMEHALPEIRRFLQEESENNRRQREEMVAALKGAILMRCEPGWVYHDNYCYLFSQTKRTWEKAVEECLSKNAYLADIRSDEENRFVKMESIRLKKEHPVRGDYYIGGYLNRTEAKWIWKRTGDTIEYTDWGPNQPDNSDQYCLVLYLNSDFRWHDIECHKNFFMICKKRYFDHWQAISCHRCLFQSDTLCILEDRYKQHLSIQEHLYEIGAKRFSDIFSE